MTPLLITRLNKPFDDLELYLLEQVSLAQEEAHKWAARAQDEYESDTLALHAYVEHMSAVSRSRAYNNVLYAYRNMKRDALIGPPSLQIGPSEEPA